MSMKSLAIGTVMLMLSAPFVLNVAHSQQRETDVDIQAGQGGASVEIEAQRDRDDVNPTDRQNRRTQRQGQGTDIQADRDTTADRRDRTSQGPAQRVSKIHGITVKNEAGKELGTVSDLAIDVEAGRVQYAALSYGGFLGVGDKLFAVPWGAFQKQAATDSEEAALVLALDETVLKKAPGFNQDQWPNFADEKIAAEIDKYYGEFQQRRTSDRGARTGADISVEAGQGQARVDVDAERRSQRSQGTASADASGRRASTGAGNHVLRASEIMDLNIKNNAGKEFGAIEDLVIDMRSGRVRYAALSYGGFLGIGDKLFAVPWRSFDFHKGAGDGEQHLVLALNEETLKNAPGFNQDNWPNLANPEFGADIDTYYRESSPRRSQSQPGRITPDRTNRPNPQPQQ